MIPEFSGTGILDYMISFLFSLSCEAQKRTLD